ncbi:MAG: cadherin domain-containing protein, partial [Planctomycetota bacterium]|nr:cadherin domain-containing protein [Planctomycetota bacterium]
VDATGHEVFGGNWDLEYTTGVIESYGIITQDVHQNWLGKLASINVTTFADTVDGDTSSVANLLGSRGIDGAISLREAILAINAGAGGDTINLSAGTYMLSRVGTGEDFASTGDLDILKNVTIVGTGAGTTTINANGIDRVFETRSGTLNLSGVTIQGGNASITSKDGGGLMVGSGTFATVTNTVFTGNSARSGGAISNDGTLTLTNVSIKGNNSTQFGGGIASVGTSATLVGVTVSNNTTTGSRGGGIYTIGGTFSATNVTISGNSSATNGGGISATSTVALQNVTITNNSASNGSGVFADPTSSISVRNTIVAGNNGSADLGGSAAFTSQGNNLIGNKGTSTGFTNGVNADQVGTAATPINPLLGALQNNGGSTLTHALLAGSTAINTGTTTGAPTADQRGISRVGLVDIGAYEFVPTLTPTGELAVNVTTEQTQETSGQTRGSTRAVSITPSGNYVVVWTSNQSTGLDANGRGILMRVFRPDGTPLTGEIQVNQTFSSDQHWATVATDSAGNGVVVWTSTGQDSGSTTGVYARRFNAAGALVGNEFLVNTTVAGNQENAAVAMTGAGAFVVTWSGAGTGDAAGVFYRRFDSSGTPLDMTERRANGTDRGTELAPSVAINDAGQFAIAWHVGNDLYTRNFAANGTAVTADIQVDNGLANVYGSAVAIDALGRTLVVYRTDGFLTTGSGVWARAFNADGTEWHTWIPVASGTGTDQTSPSVAMDDAGNFIVTYESSGDGSGNAVYVRRYSSDFSAAGIVHQVNVTIAGNQQMASVAMLDLNYFVVVWSGQGPGDNDGVFARQFSVNGVPPVITSNGGGATEAKSVAENTTAVTTVTATDADMPAQILTYSISGGADAAKFTINSSTGVLTFITAPDFETPTDFGANNVYDVVVQASDGVLFDSQAIAVTVTDQAVTVLTTTGNATVNAGSVYTLNLFANEDVTSWTINWGDGLVETFAGNPTSVTHIYNNVGFTSNILASATDSSGTVFQNQLLVPTYTGGDSVFRFAPTTGAFLQQFATSNGLNDAIQAVVGPDGKLYVSGEASKNVLRYNAATGAFIDQFVTSGSGGLNVAGGLTFGPDGNLYVVNYSGKNVLRYNGTTGAFMNVFLTTGTASPYSLTFGPDGKLYVSMYSTNEVRRYDATTGAFINTFVSAGSGGLNKPEQILFGPDGNLYVASLNTDQVLRYSGSTGAFMNAFVSAASGGLDGPSGLAFGPDGNLYVSGLNSNNVLRYDGTTGAFLGSYVTAGSGGLATPTMMAFLPEQQVKILAPVNNPPTITSNGGGATAAINVAENTTAVTTVTATDADLPVQMLTYSIAGGDDAAEFTINSTTGVLRFIIAPDYETPTDVGGNNVYDVIVQVSDGGLIDTQSIAVTVTDVGGPLIVDTTLDELDGDTSSVENLLAFKGIDGKISLREAIIAANNTPGAQIIALSNGVYALTRAGINEESGSTGDLDILGNVTIQGTGSGTTIIDGGGIDRVFDLKSSAIVVLQDLTVRNGAIGNRWGGGINLAVGANLNLNRVVVSGNSSDSGGGIYSYKATVIAVDTTISGNTGKWGGGFYNDGGNATLERVTVSDNTATTEAAGIYNVTTGATLALTNVTISGNTTTGNGGGLYTKRATTITN